MFSSYTQIDESQARLVLEGVPVAMRTLSWRAIANSLGSSVASDIDAIRRDKSIRATDREALIRTRLGQGQYRQALLQRWNRACAVTGLRLDAALRASHIKPWCHSTNAERLDPANGLLLSATIDALFDRGLISFDDDGAMLIADQVSASECKKLGIPGALRAPLSAAERCYLVVHRQRFGFA